jgi:drug/metabolite transporter (DMT)-like permease
MRFNSIPFSYGVLIAFIDAMMLTLVKYISLDTKHLLRWMIVPTVLYAVHPWIFLQSLQFESLIVMNLLVDLSSDILVTFLGLFLFKEKIGKWKVLGVALSFVAIVLMSLNDADLDSFFSLQ